MLSQSPFVIFTNDICDSINSSSYLFADDTKLFRVKINQWYCYTTDWFKHNDWLEWQRLLRFNKEKCKLLSINEWSNAKYYINSVIERYGIGRVQSEKDIGVTLDKALEFVKPINKKRRAVSVHWYVVHIDFLVWKHSYHCIKH